MQEDRKWRGTDRFLLDAKTVKNAPPGRHRDGGGLFLDVDQHGRRWIYRGQVDGKRREFGLGSTLDVPLAVARERAADYRKKMKAGSDPIADKQTRRAEVAEAEARAAVPTFEKAARAVYAVRLQSWSNGKHQAQWISSLVTFAFPLIGNKPVNEVETIDVLKVLTPIWHRKRETAKRVRQRIGAVLDWAKANGHRVGDNPVELIGGVLGKQTKVENHHAALAFGEVAQFLLDLRAGQSEPVTKLAFELLILTAVRTTEVRGADWSEIDLASKTWTVPPTRMKMRRAHIVPLSDRAIAILTEVPGERSGLIFKDPKTQRMLSENRFLNARDGIGYRERCTPHGFRSTFRDWASETTNFPSEVVEMALAHTIKSKVEAAYRRGDLLDKRRELMAAWARFATNIVVENVIAFRSAVQPTN